MCSISFGALLLLFIASVQTVTGEGSCDAGFTEWGSACYFIGTTKNYEEAKTACINRGAQLASIHSQDEFNFLIDLSDEWTGKNIFYIGLTRYDNSKFTWEDGSPLDFTSWHKKEPNNGKHFCVEAAYMKGIYGWRDCGCNKRKKYACKKNIGLCFSEGGECKQKLSNCCKERALYDPYWCNGDETKVCCLPFSQPEAAERAQLAPGPRPEPGPVPGPEPGPGPGLEPGPEPGRCSPMHSDVLCLSEVAFDVGEFTENVTQPFQQVSAGCSGNKITRSPECGEPEHVCLKHRILNLLQCYSYACEEPLELSSLLDSCSYPDCADFCNGRSVRVLAPNTCNVDLLESQCKDINGTFSWSCPSHSSNRYATCTLQ